ncbi:DUF3179 domain-containing protein [Halovenus sp. HT40]|uniref:DUF3179 domain-containing protein n=1 Tax=Halovenus sp. HT40 TaxID=3126691 RepID=UPI00300F6968
MGHTLSRRRLLGAVGTAATVGLAGCSLLGSGGERVDVGEDVGTVSFVGANPPTDEPTNAPPFGDRVLPLPVSREEMREAAADGGPGKDGIPAIDDPTFVPPDEADFSGEATVFGARYDGEAKAYPRDILVNHEIVNDTLGSTPVSVTYCPLTGTVQGFERGETTLGVSGMLVNNNLIMYDRAAERWWPQIAAASIPGPWHDTDGGATLREFEVVWTTLDQWTALYPDTTVLSEETGYARNYDQDPYASRDYYDSDSTIFPNIYENDRFHAKKWVYGARASEGAIAVTRDRLHDDGTFTGQLGDTPILAVHDPRLDTAWFYRNPEQREFTHNGDRLVGPDGDEHPPDELPLDRIISFDAYWFAWFAYYPNTELYE